MLVLTRKEGQRIEIGDGIAVVVRRIGGNRVVLGIEAPPDIAIRRSELPDTAGACSSDGVKAVREAARE